MKTAPLAETGLPLFATSPPYPNGQDSASEPFGAIFAEATEAEESELQLALEHPEETEEEPAEVPPLGYFFTAPILEPTFLATTEVSIPVPPTNGEDVRPSDQQATANTTGSGQSEAVNMVTPKEAAEGVALDPKLFEPILPQGIEATLPQLTGAKGSHTPTAPVANAAHGTLVAKLEKSVKNSENAAEIAPAIEQKVPMQEISRRPVVQVTRAESFHAETQPRQLLSVDFEVTSSEVAAAKSLEVIRVVETIRTEVSSLRQRGETTMTVVLRPDSATQLSLDVSIARDGSIHAQARCERGDFQTLNAQWPQLQQSLAAHGIRVADLSNQNNPQQQQQHSAQSDFQDFDRGQNQQREPREVSNFEDQFSVSGKRFSSVKQQPSAPHVAHSPRHWQSWA